MSETNSILKRKRYNATIQTDCRFECHVIRLLYFHRLRKPLNSRFDTHPFNWQRGFNETRRHISIATWQKHWIYVRWLGNTDVAYSGRRGPFCSLRPKRESVLRKLFIAMLIYGHRSRITVPVVTSISNVIIRTGVADPPPSRPIWPCWFPSVASD